MEKSYPVMKIIGAAAGAYIGYQIADANWRDICNSLMKYSDMEFKLLIGAVGEFGTYAGLSLIGCAAGWKTGNAAGNLFFNRDLYKEKNDNIKKIRPFDWEK
jgi:hypothetical protein